jgi:hypothetical protein
MDWVADEMKIDRIEDWYDLKSVDVWKLGLSIGGSMISNHYSSSLTKALVVTRIFRSSFFVDIFTFFSPFSHTPNGNFGNSKSSQKNAGNIPTLEEFSSITLHKNFHCKI